MRRRRFGFGLVLALALGGSACTGQVASEAAPSPIEIPELPESAVGTAQELVSLEFEDGSTVTFLEVEDGGTLVEVLADHHFDFGPMDAFNRGELDVLALYEAYADATAPAVLRDAVERGKRVAAELAPAADGHTIEAPGLYPEGLDPDLELGTTDDPFATAQPTHGHLWHEHCRGWDFSWCSTDVTEPSYQRDRRVNLITARVWAHDGPVDLRLRRYKGFGHWVTDRRVTVAEGQIYELGSEYYVFKRRLRIGVVDNDAGHRFHVAIRGYD